MRLYGNVTKCPDLQWNGNRYVCRLTLLPEPLGDRYRKELYVGAGCCCGLNTWRKEVRERKPEELESWPVEKQAPPIEIPPIMQTFLAAMGRQMLCGDLLWLTCHSWKHMLIKQGRTEEDAEALFNLALHYLTSNRDRFTKDFMG